MFRAHLHGDGHGESGSLGDEQARGGPVSPSVIRANDSRVWVASASYTRPVTVLVDQRLEFEGILGVRAVRPEQVDWHDVISTQTGPVLQAAPFLKAELLITDQGGRRQACVPIDFDRRVQRGDTVSLLGSGGEGSLQVSLDASVPATGVRMRFRFTPGPESTPEALNKVVAWFEALAPNRQLGLWMRDPGRWGVGPGPIPHDHPRVADDYARAVRSLARIQQRSGASFTMPEEISDLEAEAIGVADALVKGKTIAGRWTEASINEDLQLLNFLNESEHGALLEFKATHHLRLGSQEVPLGKVEYRFLQVGDAEHDGEKHVIRLRPGSNHRFEVRLVDVAEKPRADGSTSWVPAAMLEAYAGRWVAQSGTQLLASSDTFAVAAEKLRASGRLATIWRVPSSIEDAEALPLVGL